MNRPDQRNYSCSTHIRELELSTLIESVYHAMWKYEPSNFDDGKPINIQRNPNTHESLLHLCHVVERMRLEAKRFMHAETIRVCCAEKMKNGNQLNIVIFKWKRHAHVAHIIRSNLIWFLLEFEHFSDDYLIRRQKRKTKRNELHIQKKYRKKWIWRRLRTEIDVLRHTENPKTSWVAYNSISNDVWCTNRDHEYRCLRTNSDDSLAMA